jgi:hypothetical protein
MLWMTIGKERGRPEPRQACRDQQQVSRQHTALSMSEPIGQPRRHAYPEFPISTDRNQVTSEEVGKCRLPLLFESLNVDTNGEHTDIDKVII